MKKLTSSDWDAIQQKRPARYFIQSVEDGKVRIKFDTEIYRVEPGEKDGLGNVWNKDWNKIESKVTIVDHRDKLLIGTSKIYSLGGEDFSFFGDFIACCKRNDIRPESIPDKVFDITKTDVWEQVIEYVGSENKSITKEEKIEIEENLFGDGIEVIKSLKENSPDLVALGFTKNDFLKILSIRGKIKPSEGETLLPKLVKEKIITIDGDKVSIL